MTTCYLKAPPILEMLVRLYPSSNRVWQESCILSKRFLQLTSNMHLHVILPWSWKTCMTREDPEFDLHLLSQKPFFQKLKYSSWHDLQTCSCSPWAEKDMPVYQTPIKAVMFFLHAVYTLSALKHPFCAAARTLSFILLWLATANILFSFTFCSGSQQISFDFFCNMTRLLGFRETKLY